MIAGCGPGLGWETLFVAVDDHARIGFNAMQADERTVNAALFLCDALACYANASAPPYTAAADNGPAFRSRAFHSVCDQLAIVHRFERPYRPQTNGKTERFVRSALRERAYGSTAGTRANEPPFSLTASTMPTGIDPIKASAASHPSRDSRP